MNKSDNIQNTKNLEKKFKNSQKVNKPRIAFILAHSKREYLENSPEYYTLYALKYSDNSDINIRIYLLKKSIHLFYFQRNFKKAKKYNQELLKISQLNKKDKAYAYYWKGLIYASTNKLSKAISFWIQNIDFIKDHQDIYIATTVDLGKIWINYISSTKSARKLSIPTKLIDSDGFKKGILSGLKTISDHNSTLIYDLISKDKDYLQIRSIIMKSDDSFRESPCLFLKSTFSDLSYNDLKGKVDECLPLEKHHQILQKKITPLKKHGFNRISMGYIYNKNSQFRKSCFEYMKIFDEVNNEKELKKYLQIIFTGLIQSCTEKEITSSVENFSKITLYFFEHLDSNQFDNWFIYRNRQLIQFALNHKEKYDSFFKSNYSQSRLWESFINIPDLLPTAINSAQNISKENAETILKASLRYSDLDLNLEILYSSLRKHDEIKDLVFMIDLDKQNQQNDININSNKNTKRCKNHNPTEKNILLENLLKTDKHDQIIKEYQCFMNVINESITLRNLFLKNWIEEADIDTIDSADNFATILNYVHKEFGQNRLVYPMPKVNKINQSKFLKDIYKLRNVKKFSRLVNKTNTIAFSSKKIKIFKNLKKTYLALAKHKWASTTVYNKTKATYNETILHLIVLTRKLTIDTKAIDKIVNHINRWRMI